MNADSANYAELARLLERAAAAIESLQDLGWCHSFDTPAQFSQRVRELAERVRREDHAALRELVPIFGPTGAWDDATGFGLGGIELANQIDDLLNRLRWHDEESLPPAPAPSPGPPRS